ncbi:ABC transporter, ATP-binding protein [Actinokineospora spheciospongiae]|uniref:ABC transporter, ATP-binding protein n=1 Tax=Actinokineospora spheciospongiae TaxID=909613 RepID=W7IEP7_9PSEU|nr:ABC transporter, ATP-binding protein [Actinokineospora spheciospongiae]
MLAADGATGLVVDRVCKRFGTRTACDDLTLRVDRGEVFGFVGGNGAGKTTAMRIVLGVLPADSGRVTWAGEPITPARRARFGYLPEERGLYPRMRVLDHLVYLAELHGLPVDDAHRAAEYWIARLGLRPHREQEVQRLSLGNQQRVQLAAALVHGPELLVLDEPFSGLDPTAVDVLAGVLRDQAARGVPVLFSSHQLDLVERLCDRVGIIRAGRVVATGTVGELRAGSGTTLVVDAPGAAAGWADRLPGVRVLAVAGSRTTLRLAEGADDQPVLAAALATGPVREFRRDRPGLAELYRDVLGRTDPATPGGGVGAASGAGTGAGTGAGRVASAAGASGATSAGGAASPGGGTRWPGAHQDIGWPANGSSEPIDAGYRNGPPGVPGQGAGGPGERGGFGDGVGRSG